MIARDWLFIAISGIPMAMGAGCSSQPKPAEAGTIIPAAAQGASDTQPSWHVPGTSHIVVGGPSTDSG
ncbi:MAG TPA: hypothetical protein VHD36_23015 [Pirellulales bacterium]|nr:hypothetical protein [Pirellulales bacterium]